MSKNDGDRDERPIRFEIPHMGHRGRAPIPINQPNWKYGTSVPSRAEWAVMIFLDLIFVSLVYLISTRSSWDYRFSGLILMGVLCILITANTLRTYLRAITAKKLASQGSRRAKPKKRHPKHRKDYN